MGKEYERQLEDGNGDDKTDKVKELIEEGNKFVDKFAGAMSEARIAVEAKNEAEGGSSKKNSSQESKNGQKSDNMNELDTQDVIGAIDKVIALKGDMKLSETKEFIQENEEMVKDFL